MSDTDKTPLEFRPLGQRGINLTGETRDPVDDPLPDADDLADLLDADEGRLTADMLNAAAADEIEEPTSIGSPATAGTTETNDGEADDQENDHAMIASAIASLVSGNTATQPVAKAEDTASADAPPAIEEPIETADEPVSAPVVPISPAATETASNPDYDINTLGGSLRYAREQQGLDIPAIADHLRIRKVHLAAIEEENWDDLPGAVYIIGYLRSYGTFLGFDAQDLIDRYKTGDSGKLPANDLTFRSPQKESRMPKWSLIAATLVLAVGGYAGWVYYQESIQPPASTVLDAPKTEPVTAATPEPVVPALQPVTASAPDTVVANDDIVPETQAATDAAVISADSDADSNPVEEPTEPVVIIETPAPATVEETTETAAVPADAPTPAALPQAPANDAVVIVNRNVDVNASTDAATIAALPETTATDPAFNTAPASRTTLGVSEANASTPTETGPAGGESRITLIGRSDAYIFISDAEGEELAKRLLRKDEQFHVPDLPGLKLVTGNAGGLEVTVDGRPGKSLGPIGAVLRNLELDPDALKAE